MTQCTQLDTKISELERSKPNRTEIPTSSKTEFAKLPQQTGLRPTSAAPEAADLKSKQGLFLEWLLIDGAHREPRTETELARLLNVDIRTLMTWKESPKFASQFKDRLRTKYTYELPEIFSALITRAKNGDMPAIRLCLQFLGMFPGREAEVQASSVSFEEAVRSVGETPWEPPLWETGFEEEQSAATLGLKMEPHSP